MLGYIPDETVGTHMDKAVAEAASAFREGNFVLIYDADGREEETDMCVHSLQVTPAAIRSMRKDAGGLICMTVSSADAERGGIPYLVDVLAKASGGFPLISGMVPNDIPYDAKSAFSLTVNHRRTRTGITDNDRALTISEMARELSSGADDLPLRLGSAFRSPGHVHLLRSSAGLTFDRQGHTELSSALAVIAGVHQSATICEMMGPEGIALPRKDAMEYARRNGHPYLDGSQIIEAYRELASETGGRR